ncbi:hypothetical protein [Rhizobium giardinii]|nr:hypothetical protein [Rhizobium giardinii]
MLRSDLRYEVSRTHVSHGATLTDEGLRSVYATLEAQAEERLRRWFAGEIRIERSAEMRYGEQVFEMDVSLDGLRWDDPGIATRVEERFHQRHEELYTYSSPDQEVVFVNARVAAVGCVTEPLQDRATKRSLSSQVLKRERPAYFDGWRTVPVHQITHLEPGTRIEGPAILEAETTTVVAGDGDVSL